MRVVMLSNTALAASPYETMKVLNKYTSLEVRWVAWKTSYKDGRVFPHDLLWAESTDECRQVIREADVVHLHNELFNGDRACALFKDKPILLQAHSVPKRPIFMAGMPSHINAVYSIDQPMQKDVYQLPTLPNLIDCSEYLSIARANKVPVIVFAPTTAMPPQFPGSKAREEVMNILSRLSPKKVEVDAFWGVPYTENLKRKQRADIIIDDVVAPTWHRTTLEGCCFGCCVLTGADGPWLKSTLSILEKQLQFLLTTPIVVERVKLSCRHWVETIWNPRSQALRYVEAYEKLVQKK